MEIRGRWQRSLRLSSLAMMLAAYYQRKVGGGKFCVHPPLNWVVVSNIFYFHPYLEEWSNLTNIFQLGWNHQQVKLTCISSWKWACSNTMFVVRGVDPWKLRCLARTSTMYAEEFPIKHRDFPAWDSFVLWSVLKYLWTLRKHTNFTHVFFTGGNSIIKLHYAVLDFKLQLKDRKGNSLTNATKEPVLFQQVLGLTRCYLIVLDPWSLTWNLRIHPWKRKIIFQTIMFRFHVKLQGCTLHWEFFVILGPGGRVWKSMASMICKMPLVGSDGNLPRLRQNLAGLFSGGQIG